MSMLGSTTGNTLLDIEQDVIKRVKATGFNYSQYKKLSVSLCDLCGSPYTEWKLYSHKDRYGLPVRSMQCSKCGLIFISPRMIDTAYDEFYKKWYRKLVAAFSNRPEVDEIANRSWGIEADIAVKFLSEHMPTDLKIENMLDVGGSTGIFAEKVKKVTGCEATVVDPNSDEIKEAANRGLTVCCSQFTKYTTDKRFELISLLRTIEHVPSIHGTLGRIKHLLKLNGVFLFDAVNHDWLRKMFKNASLCTKVDHIYQLTSKTVRQYLDNFFSQDEWVIVSSDESARYILYLVKPKC